MKPSNESICNTIKKFIFNIVDNKRYIKNYQQQAFVVDRLVIPSFHLLFFRYVDKSFFNFLLKILNVIVYHFFEGIFRDCFTGHVMIRISKKKCG